MKYWCRLICTKCFKSFDLKVLNQRNTIKDVDIQGKMSVGGKKKIRENASDWMEMFTHDHFETE